MRGQKPVPGQGWFPSPYAFVPLIIALVILAGVLLQQSFSIAALMRDPAQSVPHSVFLGFVSNIGVFAWCSGAAICLFSSFFVSREQGLFLRWFGLVTVVLFLDDFFLLHERIVPALLGPVSGNLVALAYAPVVIGLILRFRQLIFVSHCILLAGALGGLGMSVVVDIIDPAGDVFFEDAFKFIGIILCSTYLIDTCALFLGASVRDKNISSPVAA